MTLAKRSMDWSGSLTVTARLSDKLEMYGKGCVGSTASGVSTGKIAFEEVVEFLAFGVVQVFPLDDANVVFGQLRDQLRRIQPLHPVVQVEAANSDRGELLTRVRPSVAIVSTPDEACSRSPATRTWKNSSRLEATIATKRTRSRSGRLGSSPRASTLLEIEQGQFAVRIAGRFHQPSP